MRAGKRDQLLEAAQRLFCRQGFHATGIDAILAEAKVARMTLYKRFKSKEGLIVAVLEREDRMFREWLVAAVERRSRQASDRVLAVYDALGERFEAQGYFGCPFLKASGEFPDAGDPIHQLAIKHKEMVRSYLLGLAAEAGARHPEELSRQLYLLMEGAIGASQVNRNAQVAQQARAAAQVLLREATGSSERRSSPTQSSAPFAGALGEGR
jgi:AcrR family transcriptional regulator